MTTTYDPFHPQYFDLGDLRQEMDRVYDLCHGCRLCFKFCPSFPSMFAFIDQHDDQDSAKLTDAERFQVVDECFNCKLCYINCPYVPGQHEWELDFPRLMLRAKQVQHAEGQKSVRTRLTDQALGRTDLSGKAASLAAGLANRALTKPGTAVRGLVEKVTGISSQRILPPYAKQRFSTWFRTRVGAIRGARQGQVALFPTCLVEYQDTAIGQDLVKVYERNGVQCELPEGMQCCGAPFLHQGDVKAFRKQGEHNVGVLAGALRDAERRGEVLDVVVPEPTCSYVLKQDYPAYLEGQAKVDADLVSAHTYDAAEYLWTKVHKGEGTELDQTFEGQVPESITYHAPCHLRAQNVGLKSRDLLKRTGAKITVVAECSGIDGTWGLRAENLDASRSVARKMTAAMQKADSEVIAGDCSLAHVAIRQELGAEPAHPLQILARAYGIEPEPGANGPS